MTSFFLCAGKLNTNTKYEAPMFKPVARLFRCAQMLAITPMTTTMMHGGQSMIVWSLWHFVSNGPQWAQSSIHGTT